MKGQSIIGRKRNVSYDFYETPKWAAALAVEAMLKDGMIKINESIYEPCAGAGAITDVLEFYGFENIKASDIQTGEYIKGERGISVYDIGNSVCDTVITNPPYNLMTKENMLAEFFRIAKKKVILVLNISYLAGKGRKRALENSNLRHIYIHSDRVTMYPYGEETPQSRGTKMYAWYVWDKGYIGQPTLSWI